MQSFLITGANEKGRLEEVEKIVGKELSALKKNPDFILLKTEEGSIGIAEIRSLQEKLSLKPFQEKTKIALIVEAQNLTVEAQNALLKTLEEPNATALLFLTAPEPSWLLPTIVSRCQIIHLAVKSQIEIQPEKFQKILSILAQLLHAPLGKRFKIAEEIGITNDRQTAICWLDKFTFVLREILLENYGIEHNQEKLKLPLDNRQLLKILSQINKYKKYLEANCNVKLTFENFLIHLQDDVL